MTIDPAKEFDFESFLKSDELASLYNFNKRGTAIQRTSGSLSTIASICMIVHILRSHHGLSTTYHRLVFGLAIADILFSFLAFVLRNIMVPKEYGYIVSGAMGNQATCNAQGFLVMFGAGIGLFYNSSICIYYLAIITFNKKDDYIRTKLEPWFHGISVPFHLALSSAVFAINGFNSRGGNCWFAPNSGLPHCRGIESGGIRDGFTIPCGRGGDGKGLLMLIQFLYILTMFAILLTPVVIVVTMALMYHTVRKAEKKMQKYGVGALRLRKKAANKNYLEKNTDGNASASVTSPQGSSPARAQDENYGNHSQFSFIQCLKANCAKIPCMNRCCGSERTNLRTTTIASQKRAILYRAVGYVTAWGLSWIPWMLRWNGGLVFYYLYAAFLPLQGVFNFIAYMLPKVRNAKKGPTKRSRVKHGGAGNGTHDNAISWRHAFLKAYMSRGPKKTSGQHRHARTNCSSNGAWRSNILKALKKLKASITALSIRQPVNNNSNDGKININQPKEICHHAPGSRQGDKITISTADAPLPPQRNNDYESPATMLEINVSVGSPPLVPSKDANNLKEEGDGDIEEHHLSIKNDTESMNNEEMEDVLDGFYLSEEIQSILE